LNKRSPELSETKSGASFAAHFAGAQNQATYFAAYFSDNTSPLKSRLTIRPFCSPVRVSTAPLWLARTTACAPLMAAVPVPPGISGLMPCERHLCGAEHGRENSGH
jgi:hypothetical protein